MRCHANVITLSVFALLSCTIALDPTPNADEMTKQVPALENISGINSVNISALPIDEAKESVKQKCEKIGGPQAYENVQNASKEVFECISSEVNMTELMSEINTSKPNGKVDEMIVKYCDKVPVFKKCLSTLGSAVEPCLGEQEIVNKKMFQNITESLVTYLCDKNGSYIALFNSEGGPECLSSSKDAIMKCANTTLSSYIPVDGVDVSNPNLLTTLDSLPVFSLDAKSCKDIMHFEECAVLELGNCDDPTPSNILDSLFKHIMKQTPCESLIAQQNGVADINSSKTEGRSGSVSTSVNALFITAIFILSLRFV